MEAPPGHPQDPGSKPAIRRGERASTWLCEGLDMGQREDVLLGRDPAEGNIQRLSVYRSPQRLQMSAFPGWLGTQKVLEKRNYRVDLCVSPLHEKARGWQRHSQWPSSQAGCPWTKRQQSYHRLGAWPVPSRQLECGPLGQPQGVQL